jgi:hypothetical protein
MCTLRFTVLAAALATCVYPVLAADAPPRLDLELAPHASGGAIDAVAVTLRLAAPAVKAQAALLRMPVVVVSTPTMAYPANAIDAVDGAGKLTLTAFDEPPTPTGTYRQYRVSRATVGDVTVKYSGTPRKVDAGTRNGPLFDLRTQGAGMLGAGVYFLALPPEKRPYSIGLTWNLAQLPKGARGVWSLGEGEQHTVAPPDVLAFSVYAMGPVQSVPASGTGNFGMYWLSTPPFDMPKLADDTEKLYRYMAKFFNGDASPYRVFARQNPYPAGGGSGFAKSFMFAYGPKGETASGGDQQLLVAHEMAHNWPHLSGPEEHGDTAWYSEGNAEFYSTALAYRAGAIDLDKFIKTVNGRAANYASNPHKQLSNAEAGKIFWSDSSAQRVPYGRGFMYLVRVDAQVRKLSGGKRSLDNLVLDVYARAKAGEKVGLPQWRALVARELGETGANEFDAMVAGADIAPPPEAFGPCLKPVAYQLTPFQLGFDDFSLGEVKNLQAGSAAAAAGVKNGDKIVQLPDLKAAREHAGKPVTLGLQRDGKPVTVTYAPSGATVPAWRWERTPAAAQGDCKL